MIGLIIAGVTAAINIFTGYKSGKKADKKAKSAGELNAAFIEEETAEAIRRTQAQQAQRYGSTLAQLGGSGVMGGSGSAQNYLDFMQTEQSAQLDWLKKSGESQAEIARKTGQMVGSAARDQATSAAIGQVSQFAQSDAANQMYSNFGWV